MMSEPTAAETQFKWKLQDWTLYGYIMPVPSLLAVRRQLSASAFFSTTPCCPPPQITPFCRGVGGTTPRTHCVILKAYHADFSIHRCCSHLSILVFVSFTIPTSFHTRFRGSRQKEHRLFCSCAAAARRVTDVELDVGWRKRKSGREASPGSLLTSCFGG